MNWYYAKDGQQAGPIDEAELATLITSGTIQGTTLVWKEGMAQWMPYRDTWQPGMPDWRTIATPPTPNAPSLSDPAAPNTGTPRAPQCSECRNPFNADDLVTVEGRSVCAVCKPILLQRLREGTHMAGASGSLEPMDPETLVRASAARAQRISPTECVSEAWRLVQSNLFITLMTLLVSYAVMGILGAIPILNWVFAFIVNPTIVAGVWLVYIRVLRGEQTSIGDIFNGFSKGWLSTVLVNLATTVATALAVVPAVAAIAFFAFTGRLANLSSGEILLCAVPAVIFVPVMLYLSIAWLFTLPLVIDRGYGPLEAMMTSMRVVNRNLLPVFVLSILCGLVVVAGALAFCVGLILAFPIVTASLAVAYEEMFGSRVRST